MYVQIHMYLLFLLSKTSPKYIFVKFKFYVRNASQLLFVLIKGSKKKILYDIYNTKYERNNFYKV